jgi:hypothetical protein
MATPEEESRKLLCLCGKHGTFTTHGLEIVCRRCKEATTVPYRISTLEQAAVFVQRRRGQARRPDIGPGVPKSRHPGVRKSGHCRMNTSAGKNHLVWIGA